MKIKNKIKNGFTLIELLVVIAIIGILTLVSVSTYLTAQVKARDSERKSSLKSVSDALMLYYNDMGSFPASFPFGDSGVGFTGENGIVYMRETPQDPKNSSDLTYQYKYKTDGKSFNLFTKLENTSDSQCLENNNDGKRVVNGVYYCYGIASPNTVVDSNLFP